jgi:hypothetical protein
MAAARLASGSGSANATALFNRQHHALSGEVGDDEMGAGRRALFIIRVLTSGEIG